MVCVYERVGMPNLYAFDIVEIKFRFIYKTVYRRNPRPSQATGYLVRSIVSVCSSSGKEKYKVVNVLYKGNISTCQMLLLYITSIRSD